MCIRDSINPDSHFFSGKGLILGGSHSPNLNSNHSLVGDLSAILIQNVNPLVNFIRVPSKKIALMSEWETKIEAIANSTIPANVTSLSGVPSWMLVPVSYTHLDVYKRQQQDTLYKRGRPEYSR